MSQNQKATNPEGVCEKLCNIVNPFRLSTPPILATDHHTNIPIGFDPHVTDFSTQKPKKTRRKKHTFKRQEIVVVDGQGNYGLAHGVLEKAAPIEAKEQSVRLPVEKMKSKKNDDTMQDTRDQDSKFSDYINEVKKKIMRTMTRINGDHDAARVMKRRDSFHDRVTGYIDQAKIKIRTTTIPEDEKGFSSK
ncbi:hypothetical protein F511_27851 [Dorcoceras hygrometricum]|uniref:Uncharacterized protein n=1 Tax=Dorcoceras hygrometricum TaxID=472368 RepID=A0A2Z7C7Z7_9LAMI|nr:hypothetical protein F511_27851 [Dorcoceras hygrometricum]